MVTAEEFCNRIKLIPTDNELDGLKMLSIFDRYCDTKQFDYYANVLKDVTDAVSVFDLYKFLCDNEENMNGVNDVLYEKTESCGGALYMIPYIGKTELDFMTHIVKIIASRYDRLESCGDADMRIKFKLEDCGVECLAALTVDISLAK